MANIGSGGLRKRVAIVGAGPLGLITTKNLAEQGFEVTTFERNDYVGGLWHANSNTGQTCVLPGTITNTSRYTVRFVSNRIALTGMGSNGNTGRNDRFPNARLCGGP